MEKVCLDWLLSIKRSEMQLQIESVFDSLDFGQN